MGSCAMKSGTVLLLMMIAASAIALALSPEDNNNPLTSTDSALLKPEGLETFHHRTRRNSRSRLDRSSSMPSTPEPSLAPTSPTPTHGVWRGGQRKAKSLPADASTRHPVALLHEMGLDPKFETRHCSEHLKGVKVQSMKATVLIPKLNRTFGPAYGRSKKEAKKRVAQLTATTLYNITFDNPTAMTDQHHDQHLEICNPPLAED